MNSTDLARFIRQNDIKAEVLRLESETPTVAAAAQALGVLPDQIIKSVLFLAEGDPVLVIANGLARIQHKRLAAELAVSRRRVKMADGAQVLAVTGYPIGAVPPFGHLRPLPTLLDEGVLREEVVFGGGGDINTLIRVRSSELQQLTGSRVVSVTGDEEV